MLREKGKGKREKGKGKREKGKGKRLRAQALHADIGVRLGALALIFPVSAGFIGGIGRLRG
jgi:hypothetical protein